MLDLLDLDVLYHPGFMLGVLLTAAAIVAALLRTVKQSSIIAFIAVGLAAGLFKIQILAHNEGIDESIHIATHIGIILLLFMAGIEMDFGSLLKRWRVVLGHGFGQIILNLVLAVGLGTMVLGISRPDRAIFFGLCLTFSSTIIVLGVLKTRKEMESYHGQIILGLMVLQDIVAVTALAVLKSFDGDGTLIASIGLIFLKLLILIAVLAVLAKWVLKPVFKHLAETRDLLFIGSLGWVLGVAAVCELFDFSPEIGAFMAGAALSFLPYKLEIQDKVEPMKDFGIILFFLSLGFHLELGQLQLSDFPAIIAVVIFVVFGTPVMMFLIGLLTRTRSKPEFFIGAIINQISEFSLILAALCLASEAKIFDLRIYTLVTVATVLTMFLSSFGHQFLERLYRLFKKPYSILDLRDPLPIPADAELEDHVIVVKYNELAKMFIDFYIGIGKTVYLIDVDPEVIGQMSNYDEGLICLYADIFDPDLRGEMQFGHAHAIISCMSDGQEAELGVLRWLNEHGHKVPFIAATDSRNEALQLYDNGALLVIQTEDLAAEHVGLLLVEHGAQLETLEHRAARYHEALKEQKIMEPLQI